MAQNTQPTAIHLSDLVFSWPGRSGFSLSVDTLTVSSGEKVFLSGASGSGKSTLLSLICGIVSPERGKITVDDTKINTMRGAARDRFRANRIGVIFQMFNLLPYASPLENILLPLAFAPERRARLKDPKGEALRLTDALGLDATLVTSARASELSIGQQQRVAAARALIGRPRLVIADEPTSALDADTQTAFVNLLMQQVDDAGATLLMVSHDTRLAERFDTMCKLSDIAKTKRVA